MSSSHLSAASLLMTLLFMPGVALAQKDKPPVTAERQDLARAKAKEALRLYEAGRVEDAYIAFLEADALFQAPTITIHLARCQRKLEAARCPLDIRADPRRGAPKDAPTAFVNAHVDAGKELADLKPRIPSLRVVVAGCRPARRR